MSHRLPRPFKLILFGLPSLALLGWFGLRWWQGPEITVEAVVRRDFVQSVVASGHVETPHRVDIGAQITSTVRQVPVLEGQAVKAGDLLVELAADEQRAARQQADLAVLQAVSRLRQLREVQSPVAEQNLRQAEINLNNANAALRRSQALFAQGFIGDAALDEVRKSAALAGAQMNSAQKLYASSLASGSEHDIASTAILEARQNALAAHARAAYTTIKAPFSGLLIARNVEVGDVVQPGKVLMVLSPQGRTQLVVEVDERNLRLLAVGQSALSSADAYPQQQFSARLAYINPGINLQTGAVQVKLDVADPPATLRQDMTVSVDIEVARRPKALLVSPRVIHDIDSGSPWVLRLLDGQTDKRMVKLGLRSNLWVELLEGLSEGEIVIPASQAVVAGVRARAR